MLCVVREISLSEVKLDELYPPKAGKKDKWDVTLKNRRCPRTLSRSSSTRASASLRFRTLISRLLFLPFTLHSLQLPV
jgi:hypothetical protein